MPLWQEFATRLNLFKFIIGWFVRRHNADRVKWNNHLHNAAKRIDPVAVVVTKLWEQQLIYFSCCEDNNNNINNNNNNNNAAKKCETEKEGLSSSELENESGALTKVAATTITNNNNNNNNNIKLWKMILDMIQEVSLLWLVSWWR
jgi:hypothetical protein